MKPHSRLLGSNVLAATIAALAVVGLGLAVAPSARAAVWTANGETRVFPSTAPGTSQTITMTAAGNEYVGEIIGLHDSARTSRRP